LNLKYLPSNALPHRKVSVEAKLGGLGAAISELGVTPSIVQADRLARALGTSLATTFA
jgi:hypothetical protein